MTQMHLSSDTPKHQEVLWWICTAAVLKQVKVEDVSGFTCSEMIVLGIMLWIQLW